MIRKKIDFYIIFLGIVTGIMGFSIFNQLIENNYYYISSAGDSFNQYVHYFNMFHDLVRSGELPFWTWTYGPGGSFWNDFGYYMLGDIFIWPLLLFPKTMFPVFFIPISILKTFLISLGTYLLLKKLGVKRGIAFFGAITNSYAVFNFDHFYTHYFFLNATVYMPFILLGYERFLSERKPALLFITLFLASISNFYFLFMISIGLFFYSFFRYFTFLAAKKSIKDFLLFHLKLSSVYLLALGSAMIVFLPSVFSFIQSSALHRTGQPIVDKFLNFDDLIRKLLWEGGINFIPLMAIPLLIISGSKQHLKYGIMGIVLVIMLIVQDINSLISGFSSPFEFRSIFIFNLLFIILSAIALNDFNFKKGRNSFVILFLAVLVYYWLDNNPFSHYAEFIKFIPPIFAVLFVSAQFIQKAAIKRITFSIAGLSIIVYSFILPYSLMSDLVVKSNGGNPGEYHKGVWGVLPLMNKATYDKFFNSPEVKEALEVVQNDGDMYRVNVSYPGIIGSNASMSYGYKSFISYQSLLKWKIQHFEMDYLANSGGRRMNVNSGFSNNTFLNTILNNKYNISFSNTQNLYGYTKVYEEGNTIIEKNENFLPVGFLYSSAMSTSAFMKSDFPSHDEFMLRNAVISEEEREKSGLPSDYESSVKTLVSLDQAIFDPNTKVEKQKNGILIESQSVIEITLPVKEHSLSELTVFANVLPYTNNSGITMSAESSSGQKYIFEKNMKYNQYEVYQYHYTDTVNHVLYRFGMDKDTEWIRITIQPGKFLLKDLRVSTNNYNTYERHVKMYQEESLKEIDHGNNYIKGNYSSESNSILFLSIPYSSGWKASIDGEEVETFPVHSAFTGLHAPSGDHVVELKFKPEGFKLGLTISIISIITAVYLQLTMRKKARRVQRQNRRSKIIHSNE